MADLLTLDELLTTTRSVRKRLDFSQSVPRQMIEECIVAAQQAPSGGNLQTWGFVEEEAAKLLGIPHADVTQVALIPVAYTLGTEFKPGPRQPLASMIHWDAW